MSLTRQTLLLFWRHAWRYPRLVIGIMIMLPLTILGQQFLPPLIAAHVLQQLSTKNFVSGDLGGSFGPELLLYSAAVIFGMIGWRIIIKYIWRLEGLVQRDLAQHIFDHLMEQSADFHHNRFGGSLVSQTNKLIGAYVRTADTTVFQLGSLLLVFIFTIIILTPKAPILVAILMVLSALYIVSAIISTQSIRKLNAAEAAANTKQTGFLADAITNIMAVKSFAAETQEHHRFAAATEETKARVKDLMQATIKREIYFGGIFSAIQIISLGLATASVVLWQAEIGLVFLVINYTSNLASQLWSFSSHTLRQYNRALGDARDMVEILNLTPEVKDVAKPKKATVTQGGIEFKNMHFRHADAGTKNLLFQNFNLSIQPGEKIGLVGHSGSGKTTLTRLLLRFSDLNSGSITIDGQDIAQLSQQDLRQNIAYVPQEPLLFHRSLRENIAYGNPNATQKQVKFAARKAYADDFIEKLPQKYETLVGERGVKLSGGQRQRVAIARAILKDAPILVLDEATSALDSESEKYIQAALKELMSGRTAIVIAHRLSTIQKMDRIVVLEHGRIVEQGSHQELLAHKGVYAELWAHQSGGFIEE